MFSGLLSSTCLACQYRSLLKAQATATNLPWTAVRHAGGSRPRQRLTKDRPARLKLSPTVGETAPRKSGARVRQQSRSSDGPFGGMNLTTVSRSSYENKPSSMQRRRSERLRPVNRKEDEPKGNDATFKALKMQRTLSEVRYTKRNEVKEKLKEITSFDEMQLLPEIRAAIASQALAGLEEITPTPIQRLAIPQLLRAKPQPRRKSLDTQDAFGQYLLAAETGSGKTLAYLVPIVDALKRAEAVAAKKQVEVELEKADQKLNNLNYAEAPPLTSGPEAAAGRPKAIIMLPSAELVSQVTSVLKLLSHNIKFRSAGISASVTPKVIQNRLFSPAGIDVLVTTPILLQSITNADPYVLSRVTHLVIDEADSLMDRSFAPATSSIIDKCASSLKQVIMCSATIPKTLDNFLRQRFPDMKRLVTPNLHVIPRRVQLGVVDVVRDPYRGNKDLACADTLYTIGNSTKTIDQSDEPGPTDTKRVLVFVNEREQTEVVAQYLRNKGIDANALHRDTDRTKQIALLEEFTKAQPVSETPDPARSNSPGPVPDMTIRPTRSGRHLPNVKVLVTTDLGSRGIDTVAVRHVILYDVPHSTIDFIHRLGRTGRMKRRGRGIILVGKKDRRDVVREVREGMFRGQALI